MLNGTVAFGNIIRELAGILERVCKFCMNINVLRKFMQNARVRSNEYLMAIKVIDRFCLFVIR